MKVAVPSIYKKSIFDIDYDALKKDGIKCLIYDVDNTIAEVGGNDIDKEIVSLIEKLRKDFIIYILTNNFNKKRLNKISKDLNIDYFSFVLKPSKIGFNKVKRKEHLKNEEICIIGDQILTDIIGGNRFKGTTILVEPLSKKDLKVTSINRVLEKKILKSLEKKNMFKKGEYYDKR